jgi:hypothetical protein
MDESVPARDGHQKILFIENEMRAVERGAALDLDCPYCKSRITPADPICCLTFGKAVRAILHRSHPSGNRGSGRAHSRGHGELKR